MEHAEAREVLEVAAVEPNGLDRLMAGDTPQAAALAGHLAGCADCTAELDRLRRVSTIIRTVVAATPDPSLKARTLDYVAAVGRDRSLRPAPVAAAAEPAAVAFASDAGLRPLGQGRRPGRAVRRVGLWAASLAAAIVVAVVGTSVVMNGVFERRSAEVAGLSRVTSWSLRIDGLSDARRVALTGSGPSSATLVYSPATTELAIVATDLPAAPDGTEYRCWVEVDGVRTAIGKMFFGGGLAYWAGETAAVAGTAAGARFGVSLVPVEAGDVSTEPVISGTL